MTTPEDALRCASALIDRLVECGIGGFVVSPGSRSTPLVLAIARSAAPSWIVLDERSAGFFALGRAAALEAPVAVVCTSGTAVANLLPSIVEASQRRVPIVALTADRPPEMHGVGANQTIDQRRIFGRFVRREITLGVADAHVADAWAEAAADALEAARRGPIGPVHVNAPFREPFIPAVAPTGAAPDASSEPRLEDGGAPMRRGHGKRPFGIDDLARLFETARRPLIYGGGLDRRSQLEVAASALGVPVVAEPMSGLRPIGTTPYALGLKSVVDVLQPDLVVQLGRAPTTRAAAGFLRSAETLVTIDEDGWIHDPDRRAHLTIAAAPEDVLSHLPHHEYTDWIDTWRALEGALQPVIDERCAGELWDGAVVRAVSRREDGFVVAGNSLPIRDLVTLGVPGGARIVANRGASGIDGLVSTLAGVASAGRPTVGILGDLSVLHDASGLAWLARDTPATLVVVDNDGGGIFDHVASAGLPEHERWFVTPHEGRLDGLLAGLGVPLVEAATAEDLAGAIADTPTDPPLRIVRARVPRGPSLRARALLAAACEEVAAGIVASRDRSSRHS